MGNSVAATERPPAGGGCWEGRTHSRPSGDTVESRTIVMRWSGRLSGDEDGRPEKGSGPDHHLERLALIHRPVAGGCLVEWNGPVEDAAGLDSPLEDIGQELLHVGPDGCRPAAHAEVRVERR